MGLDQAATVKKLKKDQVLFREGDYGRTVYLIVSGKLRVFTGRGVNEKDLATLGERQVFGEMAYFGEGKRCASVAAVEASEVIELDLPELKTYFEKQPKWIGIIIETLASHLRAANEKIAKI